MKFGRNDKCPCGSGKKYKKCCLRGDDNPTMEEFAERLLRSLREGGCDVPFHHDQGGKLLSQDGKPQGTLRNIYAEYCAASPSERPIIFKRVLRTFATGLSGREVVPSEFADAKPDILPYVDSRLSFVGGEKPLAHAVFAEHLGVGLVYDMPDFFLHLTQTQLDEWGVTVEEVMVAAYNNLMEISEEGFFDVSPNGLLVSTFGDDHDTARLLLTDRVDRLPVDGDPVAMIPRRGVLLVTGSNNIEAQREMCDLAVQAFDKPRFRSVMPFRLVNGEWTVYQPSADHLCYEQFRGLCTRNIGRCYGQQKKILDKELLEKGLDIFVANAMIGTNPESKSLFSMSAWSEGVPTLLPKTDVIAFRPNGIEQADFTVTPPITASWEEVQKVVPDLLIPLDIYPQRWWVKGFPTKAQLANFQSVI